MNPQQQTMAQSAFFYYNPEQSADNRQHGLFSPHPNTVMPTSQLQRFQQMYPQEMMGQQHSAMHGSYSIHSTMTPIASPRPMYQKPSMIFAEGRPLSLDTECTDSDGYMYPATPPLSISGSAISSPPMSSGMLPTPTGPVFFAENLEGVKEGCEGEVKSEILAGGDWTRCGSPPMTPGM